MNSRVRIAVSAFAVMMFGCMVVVLGGATGVAEPYQAVDLRAVAAAAPELSTDSFHCWPMSQGPLDVMAALDSEDADMARAAPKVLQGWESHFAGDAIELRVLLLEFTSNKWAEEMRPAGDMASGLGFPPGTRTQVREVQGTTAVAHVVSGRIQVVVSLTSQEKLPGSAETILSHALRTQIGKLPETPDVTDLPEMPSGRKIWWAAVLSFAAGMPVVALALLAYLTTRDRAVLERLSRVSLSAPAIPTVGHRDLSAAAAKLRRSTRSRWVALVVMAAIGGGLGQFAAISSAALTFTIVPVIVAAVLIVDLVWHARRARHGLALAGVSLASARTVGEVTVVGVTAIIVATSLWLVLLAQPVLLIGVPVLLFLAVKTLQQIARPLRWAKAAAEHAAADQVMRDERAPVWLYRSSRDAAWQIRTHRCAIVDPWESAATLPLDRFESVLAWSLSALGPIRAGSDSDAALPALTGVQDLLDHDEWRRTVGARGSAPTIEVIIVAPTPRCVEELGAVCSRGALQRCLFVLPPVATADVWDRLVILAGALGLPVEALREAAAQLRHVIGVYFELDGAPVLVSADRRDDLAYRVMVAQIGTELASRNDPHTPIRSTASQGAGVDLRTWFDTSTRSGETGLTNLKIVLRTLATQLRLVRRDRSADFDAILQTLSRIRELVRRGSYGAVYDSCLTNRSQKSIPRSNWIELNRALFTDRPPAESGNIAAISMTGSEAILTLTADDQPPLPTQTYVRQRSGIWLLELR